MYLLYTKAEVDVHVQPTYMNAGGRQTQDVNTIPRHREEREDADSYTDVNVGMNTNI